MSQIAPGNPFPERQGSNTVDKIEAQPTRNLIGQRAGNRWASDGTSWNPGNTSAFDGGRADSTSGASHASYDAIIAGQAAGRTEMGGTNPSPTWDAVPRQDLASFAGSWSVAFGELDNGRRPYTGRGSGAGNPNTITPLHGLDRGEQHRARYGKKFAPENGGRARRNVADITQADL